MKNGENAIRFENVSKAFGKRKVLDGITFDLAAGGVYCVLGRSGTGKSVTLKLMIGLMKPDRGTIRILDREITGLDSRELAPVRAKVGFLFQYAALFDSITVGENIAFPLRRRGERSDEEIRRQVEEHLDAVGLEGNYDKMPAELSGGMRKRAGLARALALRPSILLVDEPSSGLDPITAKEIDEVLMGLREKHGATLVIVTHHITSARRMADEMLVLDNGRVVARGAPAELETSEVELVRELFRAEDVA
ncbi:MAG: ATP-binding cassette domain-containing protein [Bryobacteraceae bacterium]|nr:ATP-binding cassette domain-containing protein [Bryobacteraceae bacterium]